MTTAGPDWLAGRSLLEHMARQGRPFSSNSIRAALRDLGFGRYTTGRLFRLAEADGAIRQCGLERSTDRRTRSRVVTWVGAAHHTQPEQTIPVRRDTEGRFTKPTPVADGPSLLDFLEPA